MNLNLAGSNPRAIRQHHLACGHTGYGDGYSRGLAPNSGRGGFAHRACERRGYKRIQMSRANSFYLYIRQSDVVGPHSLDRLREWLAIGAISADAQICPEGEQEWVVLQSIPKIDFLPAKIRERIEHRREQMRNWRSQPATEKQLTKLKYFEIPFDANNLNKARASELIDCFMNMDPAREDQYQTRPATPEQLATLRSLGVQKENLNYSEAHLIIDDAKQKQDMADLEERARLEDRAGDLTTLDFYLNDEDAFELCHYRKRLSTIQLEMMLDYYYSQGCRTRLPRCKSL